MPLEGYEFILHSRTKGILDPDCKPCKALKAEEKPLRWSACTGCDDLWVIFPKLMQSALEDNYGNASSALAFWGKSAMVTSGLSAQLQTLSCLFTYMSGLAMCLWYRNRKHSQRTGTVTNPDKQHSSFVPAFYWSALLHSFGKGHCPSC